MTTLKTKIKSAINADQSKAWLDHLKKLVVGEDGASWRTGQDDESAVV